MSDETLALKVDERTEMGKAVKALRKNGKVPANIYERGKNSQAVSVPLAEVTKIYHSAGKHHPVELSVGGKKRLVMIKDVDVEPVKGAIRHVAFHAIKQNETVTAEVPVKIEGEVPAEKISLIVLHTMDSVEIEALPANLPDELLIDGAKLAAVGDKVTVADIKVPEGVTIKEDKDQTVAVVEEPKDQIAAANAALEETETQTAEGVEAEVPSDEGSSDTVAENDSENSGK